MTEAKWGNQGQLTGVPCPKCNTEIVYNGNYFCDAWAYRADAALGECDWALSHGEDGEPIGDVDQMIWKKLKKSYQPLCDYLRKVQ